MDLFPLSPPLKRWAKVGSAPPGLGFPVVRSTTLHENEFLKRHTEEILSTPRESHNLAIAFWRCISRLLWRLRLVGYAHQVGRSFHSWIRRANRFLVITRRASSIRPKLAPADPISFHRLACRRRFCRAQRTEQDNNHAYGRPKYHRPPPELCKNGLSCVCVSAVRWSNSPSPTSIRHSVCRCHQGARNFRVRRR